MKKSSRIAIIGPVVWGGVWGHGPELARYLGRENSVTYFDPLVARGATAPSFQDTGAYPAAEGVTVVRRCSAFRLGVLYGLAMEWRNFLAVFSSGADHLITYYPLGSVLAMLWCRVRGIRSLFVYADFPDILGHRLARLVARKLCLPLTARLAGAGCVATSRLLCEDLKKFTSRCEHVPNGVGLESLGRVSTGTPSLEKSSSMSHESHPPGKRQLRVGFVGYFGHWVDLDLILETARLCPQHEFVLAGDGPAREGLEAPGP
ncbi:MAG: hypothetical protein U9P14_05330 [Gemmatimonadota bacterium]|nr:hypothetical protein [Gemmatimonadota bacterium]